MNLDGRKYVLNLNSGIIFGPSAYPEDVPLESSDGMGIGMLVHLEDVDIDPVVVMDEVQAKQLVKALKYAIRKHKKDKKKWHVK